MSIEHPKKEIRIVGWDDGHFEFKGKGRAILIGAVFRGGNFQDGLLRTEIEVDGLDATEKIISAITKSKFKDLRIIMLDGVTFGGYNIVDIKEIHEKTKLPVIAVNRKNPDIEKFKAGMEKLPEKEKRLEHLKNAGQIYHVKGRNIWFQCHGTSYKNAEEIIKLTSTRSQIPEPLRIAHIIATGIVFGESLGRA